ncbi:MAG: hypothetical protein Q8N26_19535 [Myxococcales bacterium]|nr:hypothetical protein [Myxococcales bacterium]
MNPFIRLPFLAFFILCSSCVTPLSGSLRLSERPLKLEAGPATARLVFVRPDRFLGGAVGAYLVDVSTKRVLGKSVNQTAFAVDVEPGSHLICPVPSFDQASSRIGPATAAALSTVVPMTRITVEAGRTYLFRVSVGWGPRIEAIPSRPDTLREKALLETLRDVRHVELAPKVDELPGDELAEWLDLCRLSSSDDLRLSTQPDEGRVSVAPTPPLAP